MADLKWLAGYSGQTLEELIALEDECRIDSLVLAMEQALQEKISQQGDEDLTDEERIVLAVVALEREVKSGGFRQFFLNASGEYASIAVEALLRIDCPEAARITEAAIEALGVQDLYPETLEAALEALNEARDEELEVCDGLFQSSTEDIASQLFEFVRANQAAIEL